MKEREIEEVKNPLWSGADLLWTLRWWDPGLGVSLLAGSQKQSQIFETQRRVA